jgi:hypothetical protein
MLPLEQEGLVYQSREEALRLLVEFLSLRQATSRIQTATETYQPEWVPWKNNPL